MTLMDVSDIAGMLASRIDSLVADILPAARKEGHEYRCGSVAGEPGRSMSIHTGGPRSGVWSDFSDTTKRGDALDLVAWVLFSGDKKRAVAWAKSWLGLDGMDPARIEQVRMKAKQKAKEVEQQAIDDAEKRSKRAQAIWLNANARLSCTPVDLYLLGRGIGIADLPRPPSALHYAENLQHTDQKTGEVTHWPAMVAAICSGEGKFLAVHRTFLKNHGGGLVKKAPVTDAKLVYGPYRGGFISLSRGKSGKSLKDAPVGDEVILCEGIEDGLSLALACPDQRILAAVSVGNFANLVLPPAIKKITIAADNDAPGSEAANSVQAAVDTFMDQGRDVYIAHSPSGKDFNDLLQHHAADFLSGVKQ